MSSLEDILVSAQSGSQEAQQKSLHFLSQELYSNPSNLLLHLTQLLSNPSVPLLPRHLSGIYLKNTILNSNNDPRLINLWVFLPQHTKSQIKNSVLAMLADEFKDLRQISSQIIAVISKSDLPSGQWPDLLKILLTNSLNMNPVYRESSLMTLGNICEVIEDNVFDKAQSDSILTALFSGLSEAEKNDSVMMTSLVGLRHSLRFFKANIMHPDERSILFSVIFKLCINKRLEIRVSAMEVLCEIAELYYDYLDSSLMDLGNITYNAINRDEHNAALMAVEFWCTIGKKESEREVNKLPHKGYLFTAAASLTPILLSKVHLHEEDEEISFQKFCSAALGYISNVIKDPIVIYVQDYIITNLQSSDVKLMKSAAVVFGGIMKGPSIESLSRLVKFSISSLIKLLQNNFEPVRIAASWCLSIVLGNIKDIRQFVSLNEITASIVYMLNDSSFEVAGHSCSCLKSLAENEEICKMIPRSTIEDLSSLLLGIYLQHSKGTYLQHKKEFYTSATLITLSEVMKNMNKNYISFFENKISQFIDLLETAPVNFQGIIINVLNSIYSRIESVSVNQGITDRLVLILIKTIEAKRTLYQDGTELLAMICEKMKNRFEVYIEHILPLLLWGIEDLQVASNCKSSVVCVGDIAKALSSKFTCFIPHFIPRFVLILSNEAVDLSVKIEVIDALGLFFTIPGVYQKYCNDIMQYIDSAAGVCRKLVEEAENPDLFDAVNMLRESVLCFYEHLLIGLKETKSTHLIIGKLEDIVSFCVVITQEHFKSSEDVHYHVAGLLGDLASGLMASATYALRTGPVLKFLSMASQSTNSDIRVASNYSLRLINNL